MAMVNWEEIARFLEFESPTEMFTYWYEKQQKSFQQISDIIDVSVPLIKQAFVAHNIQFRNVDPRGRIPGKFTCRYCLKEFEGDVRSVCCHNRECKEKEKEDARKMKYEATKRNRNKRLGNPCKICGRDKGENRWYCKDCLSVISTGILFD